MEASRKVEKRMREPPGQDPLQNREASLEEVRRAFERLTEADWTKIETYANVRVCQIGMSAPARDSCYLVMKAIESLEVGRRHWHPDNVNLVDFLIGAMWSISSNWARQRRTSGQIELPEADLIRYSEEGEELDSPLSRAQGKYPSPEETLIQSEFQTREQVVEEIEKLVADNLLASLIIDGWKAGMKGPEIIEALKIDENQYRTTTRLVRRRINTRWPKGMPNVR